MSGSIKSSFLLKEGIKKQVVIGGIAVVFELMGIILAGFSYVLYVVLLIFLVFASTGSLVGKPTIKSREKKK
ncbi:hypothetical protein I8F73_05085 [Enterococcus faecalis]|nr:hypothetical protein [Enterococcus faecalis]